MKIKYLILFFGFLAGFGQCGLAQPSAKAMHLIDQFANQLKTDVATDNIRGSISAAVVKNNRIIWSAAFGYADRDKNIMADTNTIYRIGSITKIFTATLLMLLVEDKKIKLDDPVETYLPEVKNLKGYSGNTRITIRQLASHTSGLNREPDGPIEDTGPLDQWENILLTTIPKTSFNSKPGEGYLYSNVGYAILGLALSRAAGMPYMQLIQQRILTPLHMDQTFFALTDDRLPHLAQGLDNKVEGRINTSTPLRERPGMGFRIPDGSLFSTPRDLSKLAMAITGKLPLLTAKSRRQMQEVPGGGKNYAIGLMIVNSKILDAIAHDGSVPGYTSQLVMEQSSGYDVILMRNYNMGSTDLVKASLNLVKELKEAE